MVDTPAPLTRCHPLSVEGSAEHLDEFSHIEDVGDALAVSDARIQFKHGVQTHLFVRRYSRILTQVFDFARKYADSALPKLPKAACWKGLLVARGQ